MEKEPERVTALRAAIPLFLLRGDPVFAHIHAHTHTRTLWLCSWHFAFKTRMEEDNTSKTVKTTL